MHRLVAKIINSQSPLKKAILITIALAIWFAIFWRAANVFAPNTMLGTFSSDAAIPVLMANDPRPITIFNWYYYGQDRWGGWPFLFAQMARRTTIYPWTDQSLFVTQAIWVFLGAFVIAGLSSDDPFAVALIYLLTICLHGAVSRRLFELSQVYAWQVTALLLAWYCLRRFLINRDESAKQPSVLRHTVWGLLTFWFSFLSIWSSFASAPILFFLLGLEVLRALLITGALRSNRASRRYIWSCALVLLAAFAELVMRMNYHRHTLKHYRYDYRTQLNLDLGHLTHNLERQIANLTAFTWWPYYLLPFLALLSLAFGFAHLSSERKNDLLARCREMLRDDIVVLIIGSIGIAIVNFALIVLVNHVRINDYDNRFMTLTYLFGSISGLLTIFLTLKLITNYFTMGRDVARAGFIVAGLTLLVLEFPPQTQSPRYKTLKDTAVNLAQKAPGGLLMGGYWETYVFSGLQSDSTMTPLPLEGHQNRMPWTLTVLQQAKQVVVEYRHSKVGSPESPPLSLSQYGNSLRLVDPKWYENDEYAFALYLAENR